MARSTLSQVQGLVEQLSPAEQASLLSTLALRIGSMITSASSPVSVPPAKKVEEAWEDLFRLGDRLAGSDPRESASMTAALLAMRR